MQNNEKHWEFRFTLKLFCQRIRWLGTICILLNRGVNVGVLGGGTLPQTYVSVGLQMSAFGLKI